MKEYPTINREIRFGERVHVFGKIDGSNLRAEWSKKAGLYKFGKRHGLVDDSNAALKRGPELIADTFGNALDRLFRDKKMERAVAFFELHGPNSFAGRHDPTDDLTATFIDLSVYPRGLVDPATFVFLADRAGIPRAPLLAVQVCDEVLVAAVKAGTLPGMPFEGVVCKGKFASPGLPLMFKIKSDAWVERLRRLCAGNETLFKALL